MSECFRQALGMSVNHEISIETKTGARHEGEFRALHDGIIVLRHYPKHEPFKSRYIFVRLDEVAVLETPTGTGFYP